MTRHGVDIDRTAEWDSLREKYLIPPDQRPPSSARGLHHAAFVSSDVEQTIIFYQGLLEFPLLTIFENRDYQGSTHFFFDLGHENMIGFFDFPGLDLDTYREVLGGHHHFAISVTEEKWFYLKAKLEAADIAHQIHSQDSLYFLGPDGEHLELLKSPLREMYGEVYE
ncbi:MAG: VOC family protein [Actinomycetes bacterium]